MSIKQGPLKPFTSTVDLKIQARDEQEAKQKITDLFASLRSVSAGMGSSVTLPTSDQIIVYPFVRHSELSYTVSTVLKRYEGFASFRNANRNTIHKYILAIAWQDGEPDLWICDGPEGVDALRGYYADHYGKIPDEIDTFTTI